MSACCLKLIRRINLICLTGQNKVEDLHFYFCNIFKRGKVGVTPEASIFIDFYFTLEGADMRDKDQYLVKAGVSLQFKNLTRHMRASTCWKEAPIRLLPEAKPGLHLSAVPFPWPYIMISGKLSPALPPVKSVNISYCIGLFKLLQIEAARRKKGQAYCNWNNFNCFRSWETIWKEEMHSHIYLDKLLAHLWVKCSGNASVKSQVGESLTVLPYKSLGGRKVFPLGLSCTVMRGQHG